MKIPGKIWFYLYIRIALTSPLCLPLLINIKPLPPSDFLAVQIESKDNSMGDLDTIKKHKNRPILEINE